MGASPMPWAAKKTCAAHGCGRVTQGRFCPEHQARADERAKIVDRERGSAAARGYGRRWRKARAAYLAAHPLCVMCEAEGVVEQATDLDHIRPHRGDMDLFWDPSNWQGLCERHHSAKTAAEDGGFGNPSRRG